MLFYTVRGVDKNTYAFKLVLLLYIQSYSVIEFHNIVWKINNVY